jgi:rhodanese-related sulfurtransferase
MKTTFHILVFLLVISDTMSGQDNDSAKFKSLPPYDFHMAYLREDKALLIDVREFFEYRKSRITDAINIPSSGNLDFAADTLNKQCALFLYCTSGFRSKRVAGFFYGKGFSKLYSLDGGIVAWRKESMPVVKKRIKKIKSINRKVR